MSEIEAIANQVCAIDLKLEGKRLEDCKDDIINAIANQICAIDLELEGKRLEDCKDNIIWCKDANPDEQIACMAKTKDRFSQPAEDKKEAKDYPNILDAIGPGRNLFADPPDVEKPDCYDLCEKEAEDKITALELVHDRVALKFAIDYFRVFNSNYDFVSAFSFGADIPLWHRLLISPYVGFPLITVGKVAKEKYPSFELDPATGEERIGKGKKGIADGFGGGLGIGALIYRGPSAALKLGVDGSFGRFREVNDEYYYKETFGMVTGGIELRLIPQQGGHGVSPGLGLGLEVGGGMYCSITNSECYGVLRTGLRLLLPSNWIIH